MSRKMKILSTAWIHSDQFVSPGLFLFLECFTIFFQMAPIIIVYIKKKEHELDIYIYRLARF